MPRAWGRPWGWGEGRGRPRRPQLFVPETWRKGSPARGWSDPSLRPAQGAIEGSSHTQFSERRGSGEGLANGAPEMIRKAEISLTSPKGCSLERHPPAAPPPNAACPPSGASPLGHCLETPGGADLSASLGSGAPAVRVHPEGLEMRMGAHPRPATPGSPRKDCPGGRPQRSHHRAHPFPGGLWERGTSLHANLLRRFFLLSSQSTWGALTPPADSLSCIPHHGDEFSPENLEEQRLVCYSDGDWPQYKLGDQEQWPINRVLVTIPSSNWTCSAGGKANGRRFRCPGLYGPPPGPIVTPRKTEK